MEHIKRYLDELFSPLPHNPAMGRVRTNLLHNMQQRHSELIATGRSDEEAGAQVVAEFSAPGDSMTDTEQQRLTARYETLHRRYPLYVGIGFGGMLVIPILILFLFLSLESKMIALTAWIVSVLAFVAFLILVTYRHETLKKQLGLHCPPSTPATK